MSALVDSSKGVINKGLTESPKMSLHTSLHTEAENDLNLVVSHYPELLRIVKVWPQLPEHIKAAIKALVHTDNTEQEK